MNDNKTHSTCVCVHVDALTWLDTSNLKSNMQVRLSSFVWFLLCVRWHQLIAQPFLNPLAAVWEHVYYSWQTMLTEMASSILNRYRCGIITQKRAFCVMSCLQSLKGCSDWQRFAKQPKIIHIHWKFGNFGIVWVPVIVVDVMWMCLAMWQSWAELCLCNSFYLSLNIFASRPTLDKYWLFNSTVCADFQYFNI